VRRVLGWAIVLGLLQPSCDRGSKEVHGGVHKPIAGTLQLTVEGGGSYWAILGRDGSEDLKIEKVAGGNRTAIAWREAVTYPREWKLKFGPSRHPTYQLILVSDTGAKPAVGLADLEGFHDPDRALAVAYFAIPLDGERELKVPLGPPGPLEAGVVDPEGKPVEGMRVTGIRTPRYLFLDGFELESVDAMHPSWPFAFWNFDHIPNHRVSPARVASVQTDGKGIARFEGFVGWVGILERVERFAWPRSLLAMPETRSVRFAVTKDPATIRVTVDKLPGRDFSPTERGLIAEGEWPLPGGFAPHRWSEKLPFPQGNVAEVMTPCREVRLHPMSEGRRISSGDVIRDLVPGETRRHKVALEESTHLSIEGEVIFEHPETMVRESCGVELCEAGPAGRVLRPSGTLRGPGVPKNGRMPFAFHVTQPGPYTIIVRAGSRTGAVVREVKAPREELEIRIPAEGKNVPCTLGVKEADGSTAEGYVVATWPHRELPSGFLSGSSAFGKPGRNTFVIFAESGSAVLRDVALEEGKGASLRASLSPGVKVTGRVVDPEGRPVAGQWVHLSWPGYFRMPSAYRWLSDLTDGEGRFEISRVPGGEWKLYARGTGIPIGETFAIPPGSSTFDAGGRMLLWQERNGTRN
jgi:hypothetical protein